MFLLEIFLWFAYIWLLVHLVKYVFVCMFVASFSQKYNWYGTLTLWMLGNFLKRDYIAVCFLKPSNSTWFLLGMVDWVANRLDLRPAAELLSGWPGSIVCISINAVPALKGLMFENLFLFRFWICECWKSIDLHTWTCKLYQCCSVKLKVEIHWRWC